MNAADTRWMRIEALFDAAIELPAAARAEYLRSTCADEALRTEVERLLSAAGASASFLEASGAQPRLAPGTRVGPWHVGALLGRGGMGEVYAARRADQDFDQPAALKLLTRLETVDDRRHFAAERRILASLQHPGIARLLDGGEFDGMPYAVMDFVGGRRIDECARALALRQRIELFLQVCDAVRYAHQRLVVHRDLKPANVLVTTEGRVKLLDFGIAKLLDVAPGDATQHIRLTPDYCAPEQLRGEPAAATMDVYALGVMLYELLCGQRLWTLAGLPLLQAVERLDAGDPPPPSSRADPAERRSVRGDLDAIALKALRPDPAARYGSVEALAEDLRAWLEGRAVAARSGGRAYRIGRMLRRHRLWFASGVAVFASLLLGLAGTAWQARETSAERDLARREAERADAVRDYLMLMFRAAGEQADGGEVSARQVLDQAADRLLEEFSGNRANDPSIMLALADLYFSLNDYVGARPLLERLVEHAAAIEPPLRAMARHDLAQIEFREGRTDSARGHLAAAQAYWDTAPRRFRTELLESRQLQSQLQRDAGDVEGAVRTLEQSLEERLEISGRMHRETGILVNNLGTAYFQAGRLDQAIEQFRAADEIWAALGLHRSADALNTLNNWASVESRRRNYALAAEIFERARALRRDLYGPSAALAALQSNLAKTLLQLDRGADALPLLREAVEMAESFTGPASVLTVSARLGLVDALTATAALQASRTELEQVRSRLLDGFGTAHPLAAMAEISRARLLHAGGDIDAAVAALDQAKIRLEALGAAGATYLPLIEQLRGQFVPSDRSR